MREAAGGLLASRRDPVGSLHQNGPPKNSKTFKNFGLKTLLLVFTQINKYLSYLNLNFDGYYLKIVKMAWRLNLNIQKICPVRTKAKKNYSIGTIYFFFNSHRYRPSYNTKYWNFHWKFWYIFLFITLFLTDIFILK